MKAPRDQHFLTDKKAIERIASAADVSGKRVLEIGPGEGALTRALLDHGAIVTAIELDFSLIEYLNNRFHREIRSGDLTLIHGNAVKCEYPPFDISVSNLPYSASSKITFRLLDAGFEEAILMYQKEFGQRMIAPPGTSGVGRLSIMVQTYAKAKPIMQLSARSFSPPPAVQSWVMRIILREPPHPIDDHQFYALIVRELFSYRRKTIRKALHISAGVIGKERVAAIEEIIPEEILKKRPEEIQLVDFAKIANAGFQKKNL